MRINIGPTGALLRLYSDGLPLINRGQHIILLPHIREIKSCIGSGSSLFATSKRLHRDENHLFRTADSR